DSPAARPGCSRAARQYRPARARRAGKDEFAPKTLGAPTKSSEAYCLLGMSLMPRQLIWTILTGQYELGLHGGQSVSEPWKQGCANPLPIGASGNINRLAVSGAGLIGQMTRV